MVKTLPRPSEDLFVKVLKVGIPSSALLHLVLLALLNRTALSTTPRPEPSIVSVDLSSLPTKPSPPPPPIVQPEAPRQIVSPSDRTLEKPPENPRFLSDRDSSVEREQIKRGDPQAGIPGKAAPQAPKKVTQPQTKAKQQQPREKESQRQNHALPEEGLVQSEKPPKQKLALSLDSATVAKRFSRRSDESESEEQVVRSPAPFSRPIGSGAQFFGSQGINDHLPNLPDGDITLLNAKADQHAVFVRRVATQVFSLLRSEGWDLLAPRDILGIRGFSVVRAKMSSQGKLLDVTLEDESGSQRFDKVLIAAAQKGTRDPNPPKGAEAEDGNIYFIFRSKSWVQGGIHPRSGAPLERRWLLLQTGLE